MANLELVNLLKSGVNNWNERPRPVYSTAGRSADLSRADLAGADLTRVDLSEANLVVAFLHAASLIHANLSGANLSGADLTRADLREANLTGADLGGADLSDANLEGADLSGADLTKADLSGANLSRAILFQTVLNGNSLSAARLFNAQLGLTVFANVNLRDVLGLETVRHYSPSSVGVDTLYSSAGQIPETFLRGCGLPDELIAYLPSLVGTEQAVGFYSCFISYSTKDEAFAKRLHARLQQEHVRVWFAPEDIKGGVKLKDQIDRAIEMHDRLLVVLSDHSLASEWVMTEVRRARKQERRENRRKLFPITLVPFDALREWERLDADTGEDLGAEVRSYFIPDFSAWKEHDAFEASFARLLRDLRAEEQRGQQAAGEVG